MGIREPKHMKDELGRLDLYAMKNNTEIEEILSQNEAKIKEENQKQLLKTKQLSVQNAMRRISAAFGRRYENKCLENYLANTDEQKKVKANALKYCQNLQKVFQNGTNILMIGSVGTGKNHLAAAIAREIYLFGKEVVYCNYSEMMEEIRDALKEGKKQAVIKKYKEADFLIVNEIGKSYNSDAEHNWFFEILDWRYSDMKPSLFIFRIKDKESELSNYMYHDLADRLKESSAIFRMNWKSYRGR